MAISTITTFGTEKVQVAPDVIEHQLPNCRISQCSEPPLEQPSHAQCADHAIKRVLGSREPSLFLDQALPR